MQREKLEDINDIARYVLSGKGKFTLHNPENNKHFTFKLNTPKKLKGKGLSFVQLMTGSDNLNHYTFIGTIFIDSLGYSISKKSRIKADHVANKAMLWLLNKIKSRKGLGKIDFYHEGVCCNCARPLTNPESIKSGIGPKCIEDKYSLLYSACQSGDIEKIEQLMVKYRLDLTKNENMPLKQADKHGQVKVIERLLKVDRVYELVEKNPALYGDQTNVIYARISQKKIYQNTDLQEADDLLDLF